ncbi:MAG TPA: anthranilate synthase component I, partial [Pirellulales bacterium]
MPHLPDLAQFSADAQDARLVPVYRRLTSDTLTPVSAFHRLDRGSAAFLFESVIGGEKIGRYSFLGSSPFFEIEAYDREVVVRTPDSANAEERYTAADPLGELQKRLAEYPMRRHPELPPFVGGAIGYAGYDTVRY